jgi:hypothetical protein
VAVARLVAILFCMCVFAVACGTSPCGLKLQEHLFLPAPVVVNGLPEQRNIELPCCSASVFRDVNINVDDVEADLTNPNGDGVDGFVTNVGCDKLFDGQYSGSAATPLCQVHIGPVRPRGVSGRTKLAPGRYRIFAQGYASSTTPLMISLDLGLWSSACRWNPIGP